MSERIYKKRKHWESEQMKESLSSTSASTNQQSIIGLSEEERIAESERENQAIVSAFLDNQDNQSVIQHNSNIDGSDASWSQSFSNHSINQALQQVFHTSTGGRSYDIQSYDNSSNQFQFSSNQSVIQNDLGVDSTYPTSPRSFSGSPLFGQSSNQSLSHWLNNGQSNNNQPSPTMSSPALPSLNLNNPYYSWNPSQSSSSQSSPPSNDGPSSVITEQNQTSMSNNLSSQHPHSQPLVRRRLQSSQARSQAPYSAQMAVQALGPSHIDQSMNPTPNQHQQKSNQQNSSNTNTRPSVNPNLPSFVQSMYGLSPQSSPPAMQSPSIISVSSVSSNNSANLLNNQSVSSRSGTGSSGQLPTLWSQSSQSSNQQLQRFQSHPDDSHFKFTEHEILAERYEVLRVLGRGTFAQALLCRDLFADHLAAYEDDHPPQNEQMRQQAKQPRRAVQVAVKVVRNVERYRIAAQREIQVLKHLTQRRLACVPDSQSARGAEGCIPFLGSFILPAGHPCMVFPVLNQSLYDFLRFHQFRPLMAAHVRHIAFQLLVTCQYLHDECGIVHADIKPENVLFVDSSCASVKIADVDVEVPYNTAVRLIDFGTAVFINQRSEMPAVVASRAYRSIEVVLGTGWSTGVDMWAIGCLLMEIYTGHRLFDIGHGTDADHLNAMTAILGPIPAHVKNKPRVYAPQNEQSSLTLNPPFPPQFRLIPLHERIVPGDWYFYDLVSRLLAYDTSERVTAQQALQHPYFTQAPDYSM